MISIASRINDANALEKSLGNRPDYAQRATVRSGVGIIPVMGPTFKRANLFTEVCGATSYEIILRDFHAMLGSSDVKVILLNIDSPGGEANGCSELAEHIYESRSIKPIYAYVGGMGASAAYWIASAASRIFAADTAMTGSIGVQTIVRAKEGAGELRFVSSVSPNKNRDPGTELGAGEVQRVIDDLGQIFVQKVARNRGVTTEKVLADFGQGSVFISEKSFTRGMIDDIKNFEGTFLTIIEDIQTSAGAETSEAEPQLQPQATDTRRADADRMLSIQALAEGRVSREFAAELIRSGASAEEAALRIITEENAGKGKKIEQLKAADQRFSRLDSKPAPTEDDSLESDLRLAASIGLVDLL